MGGFYFGKKIQPADFEKRPISDLLPEGRHVQIAAALPTESAYERSGHGVFTQMLLEVLQRSDNRVTYYDLQSRIRQYVKNNFKQTPQVYASEEADSELFRFFLDLEAGAGAPLYGNVYERDNGWYIDLGHLQGISAQARTAKVVAAGGAEYTAQLGKIQSSETQLLFEQKLPSGTLYKGFIDGFLSSPIKVFVAPAEGYAAAAQLLQVAWNSGGANIHPAAAEYEADYTVHADQQGYVITRRKPHRPLVATVKELSVSGAKLLCCTYAILRNGSLSKTCTTPIVFCLKNFRWRSSFTR
ncbi:MAG: caspase family protein [Saprospiraceae bacterium]|nr:caspase family protein [Saprospiraceae bacterium]